jgi:hypothetical protein
MTDLEGPDMVLITEPAFFVQSQDIEVPRKRERERDYKRSYHKWNRIF